MFYRKGSFIVIPNKKYLKGEKSIVQAVFFWICEYADDWGFCFPSRETLASNCNCDTRTIDKAIKRLEEICVIEKTKRKKPDGSFSSNLYQIIYLDAFEEEENKGGVAKKTTLGSEKNDTRGSEKNVSITQPNIELNLLNSNSEQGSQVNEMIKAFEVINPACSRYYGNKTQRKSCEDLIRTFGFDRVMLVITKTLPMTNKMAKDFFPNISTPLQLFEKWSKLEDAVHRYKTNKEIPTKYAVGSIRKTK